MIIVPNALPMCPETKLSFDKDTQTVNAVTTLPDGSILTRDVTNDFLKSIVAYQEHGLEIVIGRGKSKFRLAFLPVEEAEVKSQLPGLLS